MMSWNHLSVGREYFLSEKRCTWQECWEREAKMKSERPKKALARDSCSWRERLRDGVARRDAWVVLVRLGLEVGGLTDALNPYGYSHYEVEQDAENPCWSSHFGIGRPL